MMISNYSPEQNKNYSIADEERLCSSLTVTLCSNGCLSGPHLLEIEYIFQNTKIKITIEQNGIRIITLITNRPIKMKILWNFYCQLEKFFVLLDGQFYLIKNMTFSGNDCTKSEYDTYASVYLAGRPDYCKTDSLYCHAQHSFLKFDAILSPDLLAKWFSMQEELDIVNQILLYNISNIGITHDVKCAYFIECLEPLSEVISIYDNFFPSLKPGEKATTLKMCMDAVISKYGVDIFSKEYASNKDKFLQILVNTRNRIMHIKRKQPKDKYLSGPESVLYLVKLCHLYRVVILSLLGIDYDLYKEKIISSVKEWNKWKGILDSFLLNLK